MCVADYLLLKNGLCYLERDNCRGQDGHGFDDELRGIAVNFPTQRGKTYLGSYRNEHQSREREERRQQGVDD